MAEKSLEERIRHIEEVHEKRIQRLEDIHEIANLFGTYVWRHNAGLDYQAPDTLYAKAPDISSEVAHWGVLMGDVLRNTYRSGSEHEGRPGGMIMHHLDTPVIEVAGDGKTAKGIWLSPGHETAKNPKTGECEAFWCWTKYGVDFIKEDGRWKVWHYHVYRIFRTPFNKPWTEEYELKMGFAPMDDMPFQPGTYDHPYSTTTTVENVPPPPEPYETWNENMAESRQR